MTYRGAINTFFLVFLFSTSLWAVNGPEGGFNMPDPYTITSDTLPPLSDRYGDFVTDGNSGNPFDLQDPKVIEKDVEYDPQTGYYIVRETIDGKNYRPPMYLSFEEYLDWKAQQDDQQYMKSLYDLNRQQAGDDPILPYKERIQNSLVDRLFCGSTVDVRPQGNIDLTFGVDFQRIANPILTERQQRQGGFDFDMNIQMNVVGKIGQKLQLSFNYNTQATFDFDRQIKVQYLTDTPCSEDDIVRKIDAGNVSFPLRTSLIQGRQNLFGFMTELQFGRLTVSMVASQSQTQRKELQIQGGAQQQNFEVNSDNYDENRHFFLSHYNRNSYEENMKNLPQINALFNITKIEVWITNDRNVTEGVRDVVAYADLGETNPDVMLDPSRLTGATEQGKDLLGRRLPDNYSNTLYDELLDNPNARGLQTAIATLQSNFGMTDAEDFSKIRARQLAPSEYSFHPQLGFISLNVSVKPTDVIGVAYQYTYNGKTYQVGEFAQDLPIDADTLNVMHLKLLKGVRTRVDLPIWDLMMKNIYSLGAYQINPEDFRLDVFYQDPGGGEKRFIPEGPIASIPLLRLLNLDNLNRQGDPFPDGQFDFVPGITILPQNGRVIFPVLEPFGSSLDRKFWADPNDPGTRHPLAQKYVYQQLYDSTVTIARQFPEFNRFVIRGTYKSSVSSEISLGGFGIPKGSVVVSAGGAVLAEGTDYTIDYNLGRIKILNEAYLNSGQPIRVTFEDNSTFGFNRQSFFGTRMDYFINEKFNIGGTFLHLSERPFTQKVNYGDDPIANSIYGFDVQYSSELPWLTRIVDKIPLISTKEKSSITFSGEFAHLLPGSPRVIDQAGDKGGVVFLDDFEGAASNFNLTIPSLNWRLASTPRGTGNDLFPEANLIDSLAYNDNRALIAWYQLDPDLVTRPPDNATEADAKSVYVRQFRQDEIFRNFSQNQLQSTLLRTFDLAYYPKERGPYNFDPEFDTLEAEEHWGGVMRSIQNNDFEANNIEFVEVWVMSPFKEGYGGEGGQLYIELGDVSEDILRDSRLFFENGLPDTASSVRTDTTVWSRIPRSQAITNAFDNDPAIRDRQDVGLDGFDDAGETVHFQDYLNDLQTANPTLYAEAVNDPAGDNFRYFRDEYYDNEVAPAGENSLLWRYKYFNNPQGNSSPDDNQNTAFTSTSTNVPDSEDINRDNTLNEEESYFQYQIPINKVPNTDLVEFTQYTFDSVGVQYEGPNGPETVYWYQLKIPINQYTKKVGGINDFRSIRFIRMYMTGFEDQTVLRFARLDLIRNQWRRYLRALTQPGVYIPSENEDETVFDVNAVNIEENGQRTPFPYVLPPGVQREQAIGALPNTLQNEQSLSMNLQNLKDGDARGIYKIVNFDMRVYQRLKMFVHAESLPENCSIENDPGDLSLFVRIGSDFENNYYEYEIPLTMSNAFGSSDPEDIWLEDNTLDFALEVLRQVKINRDLANISLNSVYTETDPDKPNNLVKIIGNPDLGMVEGIMIGVRNQLDDGINRCVEVWVNELRLTGFDERGGTAALMRTDITLADLGQLTLSGQYQSIGFGQIEQRVNQRARERLLQYDASGSFNLDKFFPKNWKLRIPFYVQYAQEIHTPEYDPYQLDIPLAEKLRNALNGEDRDSIRRQAEEVRTISSFNFTNVRKERTSKIPLPIDLSNFTFTYAQTRNLYRSPIVANEELKEQRGVVDYNYAPKLNPIYPFKKLFKKKSKWLALIQDFNFNPLPNTLGVRNELRRTFIETTYRFSADAYSTWYDKRFSWDRSYNLQWDFAKSLKFNYSANNNAVIDEPLGRIDSPEKRDTIWQNLQSFGRNKNYQHNMRLSYNLPLKKIPILDWVNVQAQYQSTYNWSVASLNTDSLGNIIGNTHNRQVNADFQFTRLYKKSKYLTKIERKAPKKPKDKGRNDKKPSKPKKGKGKDDKDKKEEREPSMAERILIRPLLMLRRARLTYQEDYTTSVPGFMGMHRYVGQDFSSFNTAAPGWDFISGINPMGVNNLTNWLDNASTNGWITDNIFLTQQVTQIHNLSYSAKVTVEPFTDFKIDVDLNKTLSENFAENFKVDTFGGTFRHLNPMEMGSVNVTFMPIRTMFDQVGTNGQNSSATFEQFENNRQIIAGRIGTERGISAPHDDSLTNAGYVEGFGRYQQDVLIPAFLAAYTGVDASQVNMGDIRNLMPLPNWKLTYNGLAKLDMFKKIFASFSLTHGYQSKLTVNSFATDLDFQEDPDQKDPNSLNYYSSFEVPNIVISEQFTPLIGVDMRFKNDISARFNYKKSRNLAMSFVDYQLSQTSTEEITFGFGMLVKNFTPDKLNPFRKKDDNKKPSNNFNFDFGKTIAKNELDIRFEFSYRDDKTINHVLDQNNSVATRGMKTIRISPSIDYAINNRLTVRLFYDYNRTIPAVSTSFPVTNTKGGVTVRFSLAQ
jgi:cell surface protein SprA